MKWIKSIDSGAFLIFWKRSVVQKMRRPIALDYRGSFGRFLPDLMGT